MPEIGQRRLCLREPVELKWSHYLPAGIYRALRDEGEKNPNPVKLTDKGAVRTSKQMAAYLLCEECEERFDKGGENWVLANFLRKEGHFPLAKRLETRPPDMASDDGSTKLHLAARIPAINATAIGYFATSIFWRGSIHGWNEDGTVPVRLGPYQEEIRRYLMGSHPFPENCALMVILRAGTEATRLTHGPGGARTGNYHAFRFPMPGFVFLLAVGRRIPPLVRTYCFVRGSENPIIVGEFLEGLIMGAALKMRMKSLGR